MTDTIELTPSKETYRAIEADVDVTVALQELIDNAIDNGIRQGRDSVSVEIERDTTGDTETVVIRDDSGGIPKDELSMLFALGESRKEDIQGSIGAFGIGAKKALMRLGNSFTIVSRAEGSETAWGYSIDDEWLDDNSNWEVELQTYDLSDGTTELRITDVNFEWGRQIETIQTRLRDTYRLYLQERTIGSVDIDLDLTIDSAALTPPDPIEFSYPPWDGLHPRRFEGFILNPATTNDPVEMRLTVGLMKEGDADEAGTDIFCQNRLVSKANRDAVGGFNVTGGLPKFREETHKRLKIQVEFLTEGDAADLPWNAHKSEIHADDAVMREAIGWIRKTADRYMQAKYGEVPAAFFEPYDKDSTYAANGGEIEGPIDYSTKFARLFQGKIDQVHIKDKPEKGRPQIRRMKETVEAHTKLGIKCETVDWFEPWMLPTYRTLIDNALEDSPFDSLTSIETAPPDFTGSPVLDSTIEQIEQAARRHAANGFRGTDIRPYQQPVYREALEEALRVEEYEYDDLDPVSNPEDHITDDDDETDSDEELGGDADGSDIGSASERVEFAPFSGAEIETLRTHIGDVADASPEERKQALLEYLRRLEASGIRIDKLREE